MLAVARERPELAQAIVAELPDTLAEVAYAARHQQARTIGDVLLRRTRLGLLAGRELAADGSVAARVGAVLAAELGWEEPEQRAAQQAWGAEARAEGVVGSA